VVILELTQDEFKMLDALIDAGVKTFGIRAVTVEALSIRAKMLKAVQQSETSNQKEQDNG
jgi:hypothetical protein